MSTLTPEQLNELRVRLEQDRASLQAEIDDLQTEFVNAENNYDPEFSGYGNHMAETGTEIFDQERGVAIQQSLKAQLAEVEHALAKFEDGTYGICENCGKPISFERLQAWPQATLCINDKERLETQQRL